MDNRQERAERPDPVRPDPEIHEGDDLHLHVDDEEGGRDAHQQNGGRGDDEPDEPEVRREEIEDAAAEQDDDGDQADGQDRQDRQQGEDHLAGQCQPAP